MTLRTTIFGVAISAVCFSASAQAQEFFQAGSVPAGDLLAPPVSSVVQSAATPLFQATAFTSRNTTQPSIQPGYTVLSAEDAALLAAQAVGEPVTIGGFGQTAATAPTSLVAFPSEATLQPLLTTPAGVDTGLTAVAIVNGVPVTSGPVTNIRGGYGNTTTISSSSFGGSVLVSYGSDLPIVGPEYTRQLPGSGLSNPTPIPYVGADRADAVAAAARSGMDSVANSAAMIGTFPLATNFTGPIPLIRPGAPGYKKIPNAIVATGTTRSTSSVPSPFPTEQEGSADAAGENIASPVNESKDAVQSFSRITEEAVTAGATTPQVATSTGNGTSLVSRNNRDLAAAAAEPAATAAAADTGTTFVSRTRSLADSAAVETSTPSVAASTGASGCTSDGVMLQFDGTSNRFTADQTATVKSFGELCLAAKQKVQIIGYADPNIVEEDNALRIVKGRVLRALHALTDAGLDDSMVTRETLIPSGGQPSNALIVRAN
ncbi:MAG: hypothetical protein P8R39_10270 [Alphaproteobacteria bacterium]|nr:hypothetical protein [Alphaproteobacteria bacterium]